MAEKVNARFEPFDRAETHFTLYEGMKVYIISLKDNWYKIRRSDKKVGWVEKEDLGAF
ncbi:MAG: SH3 domain-containing protein [Thermodesulfobacteriota bacterium]